MACVSFSKPSPHQHGAVPPLPFIIRSPSAVHVPENLSAHAAVVGIRGGKINEKEFISLADDGIKVFTIHTCRPALVPHWACARISRPTARYTKNHNAGARARNTYSRIFVALQIYHKIYAFRCGCERSIHCCRSRLLPRLKIVGSFANRKAYQHLYFLQMNNTVVVSLLHCLLNLTAKRRKS